MPKSFFSGNSAWIVPAIVRNVFQSPQKLLSMSECRRIRTLVRITKKVMCAFPYNISMAPSLNGIDPGSWAESSQNRVLLFRGVVISAKREEKTPGPYGTQTDLYRGWADAQDSRCSRYGRAVDRKRTRTPPQDRRQDYLQLRATRLNSVRKDSVKCSFSKTSDPLLA
jgi:hypothetical protein